MNNALWRVSDSFQLHFVPPVAPVKSFLLLEAPSRGLKHVKNAV